MQIKTVDAKTLRSWIDKGEAVVVDVREQVEYEAGNISGATNIPLAIISKELLPSINGKKLVVHCRGGGRSSQACAKLLAETPELEIYNLEGGISAWTQTDSSTEASSKFCTTR